jgi:hypothetical protein
MYGNDPLEFSVPSGAPTAPTSASVKGVSDAVIAILAQSILGRSTLLHPTDDPVIDVSVPTTATVANPFTVYSKPVSYGNGALLASVSISTDAIFQANYDWTLNIDGVSGPQGKSQIPFDPTVNTFEAVPSARTFYLKPGAAVTITASNSTGTSSTGIMSVYVVTDQLTEYEAAIITKYNALLARAAQG